MPNRPSPRLRAAKRTAAICSTPCWKKPAASANSCWRRPTGPPTLEGCHFDKATQTVTTPKGFKEAFKQFADGGWTGLTNDEKYGGQALPGVVGTATTEIFQSGNLAWSLYPLLSEGATHAMEMHGEEWQREHYMKPIVEGRWTGTMCLTEPQAGSDLGLLKTRAEPAGEDADGHALIQAQRHQDLHQRRRARPDRKHRAPGAGPPARRAGGQPRHLDVHRAEIQGQRRRLAGRAQRHRRRRDRAQDGHPRLLDLRDEPRRRRGLPDRQAEQGPDGHVHHDECRAPRGRCAGSGAGRARPAEQPQLCPRPAAVTCDVRREVSRQAGRQPAGAAGHPAHAADPARLRRRFPRTAALHLTADRYRVAQHRRGRTQEGRPSWWRS